MEKIMIFNNNTKNITESVNADNSNIKDNNSGVYARSNNNDNANIIALGSRLTKNSTALKLVNIFLSTKFEGGRHLRRVKKV